MLRRQPVPRPLEMRIPLWGALTVQKRNEDRRFFRSLCGWRFGENQPAPVKHITAVAHGASEEIRILVGPIAKRSGILVDDSPIEGLPYNGRSPERDRNP